MEKDEKRPIASVLRSMKKGNTELFPKSQYGSLNAKKYVIAVEIGGKFSIKVEKDCVKVTRTA